MNRLAVRVVLAALLCSAVLAGGTSSAHAPKREDYVGHFDPLTYGYCRGATIPVNVGRVCFTVKSTDKFVDIVGTDAILGKAGMFYIFRDRSGDCVGDSDDPTASCDGAGFLCGRVANLGVPRGTVKLDIYTGGILNVVACNLEGSDTLGITTTGTITAHLTARANDR